MSTSREPPSDSSSPPEPPQASPMSLAVEWVARITAVALVMVLPGVGGQWLDARFETSIATPIGFGLGLCVGFVALLAIVKK